MTEMLLQSAGAGLPVRVSVISTRILTPWKGAWIAEVDVDPDAAPAPITGKVVLTIGAATLAGTVDPRGSGRFNANQHLRVVAGAGGWDKLVTAQHFHDDGGVSSSTVESTTAAQVGETVNDPAPVVLGPDYVRSNGPASRIFGGRDWYVDGKGVTQISSRSSATPDGSLEVLGYDPLALRLEVASDALVLPGTAIADTSSPPRWDGTLTVRDVEQTIDAKGSHATLWCSATPATRLATAIANAVKEFGGITYLRRYAYRVVGQDGARLLLQAITTLPGLPDLVRVPVTPGTAGLSSTATPSSTAYVVFVAGDPSQPVVVGYDGTLPVVAGIDATGEVDVGKTAALTKLGKVPAPLAAGVGTVAAFTAVNAWVVAFQAAALVASPALAAAMIPANAALAAALLTDAAAAVPTTTVLGGP